MIIKILLSIMDRVNIRRAPARWLRRRGAQCGEGGRFYGVKPGTFGSEPFLISIGDRVTITDGVRFVTHDGALWIFRHSDPALDLFDTIRIGNDVFIGLNSIILPGTNLGDNCIVGAGSIVKGSFPSGCVIAGNPARVKYSVEEYLQRVSPRVTRAAYGFTGAARREAILASIDKRRGSSSC